MAAIAINAFNAGAKRSTGSVTPGPPNDLVVLALAGAVGYLGDHVAAKARTRAGAAPGQPALIADGDYARADAYASLAVIASAAVVAIGLPTADPLIGLAITAVIPRITRQSWVTVGGHHH